MGWGPIEVVVILSCGVVARLFVCSDGWEGVCSDGGRECVVMEGRSV